jgi:VWFA-related protein
MTWRRYAAALLALLALLPATSTARQFTVSTSGVRLDVLALNGQTPHIGLTRDDFEVRDNGVRQQLDSVSTTDAAHVVIVLDVSGSVQGEPLRRLTTAANALVARLTPKDRLTLVGFSHHLRLLTPVNGDIQTDLLPLGGTTALHDAVFASVLLAGDDPRPGLMILLTDGFDSVSWLTATQALEMALRADVVIYPVVAGYQDMRASEYQGVQRARRHLEALATETGGRIFPVTTQGPMEAFLEIINEYRHRYVLTYSPTGVERRGWHRVDVRLLRVRGTVHTRRGYDVR